MSITDELRKWKGNINTYLSPEVVLQLRCELNCIADRIDAEHEADVSTACRLAAGLDNDALSKRGYIALPVDADGVPIRIGDVMEERSGHTFEVASLMAFGGSENWLVLSDARNFSSFREPHDLRHYHAPTVEDVLREFAEGLGVPVADSYIAASAAKLRLAGEDE